MPQVLPADTVKAACRGELQPVLDWVQKSGENGYGLLHGAAGGGQLRVAKELLQRGASIDLRGAGGITPLMGAVSGASTYQDAIVRLLLKHKASVDLQDADKRTALMMAACKGQQECVQELLQTGASTELRDRNGHTALQLAEAEGHVAIAELIRQNAATPPASVAFSLLEKIGNAAHRGELQPVVEWLQKGGHVDALAENGDGLLRAAAHGGRLHVVKELLKRGASVDLRGPEDITALMAAAAMGQRAMVRLLLEHKASVDLQASAGATALMGAARNGHTECVQELLEAGASTEVRGRDGITALELAEHKGHTATAELLRQHAAAPPAAVAAPTPNLSGRRVRIGGLKARPELNGQCGVAGRFDAAKGRYEVAVEGEAGAVLLKPANLQDGWLQKLLEPAVPALTVTLTLSLP